MLNNVLEVTDILFIFVLIFLLLLHMDNFDWHIFNFTDPFFYILNQLLSEFFIYGILLLNYQMPI